MKKTILILIVSGFFLWGCGNKSKNETALNEEAQLEIVKEVQNLDSLSNVIDKAKENIDSSAANLDELLNDL